VETYRCTYRGTIREGEDPSGDGLPYPEHSHAYGK
jgi:hypothetical protein